MSPTPNETVNGDVKPNISQIKRSATPADQNQGTPNANSLGTPNPSHSLGTPNPPQPMDVQVKEEHESPARDTKPTVTSVITASLNPVQVGFGEILNCAYHRDVIIQLASILQVSIFFRAMLKRLTQKKRCSSTKSSYNVFFKILPSFSHKIHNIYYNEDRSSNTRISGQEKYLLIFKWQYQRKGYPYSNNRLVSIAKVLLLDFLIHIFFLC